MNSSAKQILIGWIYRRIGFLKRGMKKQIKPLAAILRFLDFSIPPYRHFERSREIFLALRAFLLPSQKHSRFLLSHIRHYPLLQERSLHFGRDDDTGIALSKHIRCTLLEINPVPPPSFQAQREIFLALCSFLHTGIASYVRQRKRGILLRRNQERAERKEDFSLRLK